MQRPEQFEKFYYSKVGLGEACGCAERVIDVFEFNRRAGATERGATSSAKARGGGRWFALTALACKFGLLNRKKTST